MKNLLSVMALVLALGGQAIGADYMTPEQIQRIWGEDAKEVMPATFLPRVLDFQDMIDQYAEASAFIRSLQYTASDTNIGGLMEAEHLLSIIQTDNTSEAIWIWSRYFQVTGDTQYYQNTLNAWHYLYNWPAWREEGGGNPSSGYYRFYVGGWGLLAEKIYRDVYGSDFFRVYADSVADYMVSHSLTFGMLNVMVYSWAMGCLYIYGEDIGNQDYMDHADSVSTLLKEWVEVNPQFRLSAEQWAMSGGATFWGLMNSYFAAHPEEAFDWATQNAPYLDTLDTLGEWHLAHNAWYALGHWTAFDVTGDSTFYYNHAFLTDTLIVQDGDNDGGIPAAFADADTMDQSWCTAYLGFMCLNPLLPPATAVGDGNAAIPTDFIRVVNYPNPFNDRTKIMFSGFPSGEMKAEVFDLLGRRIQIINPGRSRGSGVIDWYAGEAASGIYFIKLSSSGKGGVARAILIK